MAPTQPQQQANGVLPVPAAALQKNAPAASNHQSANANGAPRGASHKSQAPRLKLVVRRLAPGLTQQEFELALGDEWKLGAGRVDWFTYKAGKISKDLAKPSKPSRAYLHLTEQGHVAPLADKVRKTAFSDAKNSTKDPALIGPPSVEFAPFNRIPGGRRRNDARQGLIDQDPEFKDFLESLTNPVPKPTPTDVTGEDTVVKKEEIKTTPLIEHLKEKKAAKEKPQPAKGQGKHARGESKDDKAASKSEKKGRKGAKDAGGDQEKGSKKSKAEKAAKDSTSKEVKILNKESAKAASASTEETKKAPNAPAAERKRERGNASIAKQMLQRDLGIGPAAGGRRGRREAAAAAAAQQEGKTSETASQKEAATPPAPSSPAPATTGAKADAETRSPKKDSRPTRAERRAQKAAKANAEAAAEQNKPAGTPAPPTGPKILKKPQQQSQKASPAQTGDATAAPPPKAPTGPAAQSPATSRPNSSRNNNAVNNAQAAGVAAAAAAASSTARQAFLKHANPSQGITEPLIEAALSVFGAVDKVEIDKRKGFAYVDFAEPAGLQKAIAASPVKVAEGAVQVLERKDKTPAQRAPRVPPTGPAAGPIAGGRGGGGGGGGFRGGRGGRRGGGGGGGGGGANVAAVTPASANATAPAAAAPAAAPAAPAAKPPAPVADTPS